MKKINDIIVDEELITRLLAGEATPEEAIAIHNWMQTAENRIKFNELNKAWKIVSDDNAQPLNVAEQWDRLEKSVSIKSAKQKLKYRTLLFAAAALIILFIAFNVFKNISNTTQPSINYIQVSALKLPLKDTLADKSIVILNSNSSIKYANTFNKNNREVLLTGEAYFNIMPDKKNPFIIHIDELNIKVTGTKFNVINENKQGIINVQVQSGTVIMYTSNKQISVTKGQTGTYNKIYKKLSLVNSIDENSFSYATQSFTFTNQSLDEIAGYLEKAFGLNIQFKNAALKQCRISARFQNKTLDYILHVISVTLNITYYSHDNAIVLDGEACN